MRSFSRFLRHLENVMDGMEYEEVGELTCALLHYANTGQEDPVLHGTNKIVFELICAMFDREAVADAWCGKETKSAEARE